MSVVSIVMMLSSMFWIRWSVGVMLVLVGFECGFGSWCGGGWVGCGVVFEMYCGIGECVEF